MKLLWSSLAGLIACGAISLAYAAEPAQPSAPAVSNEANTALQLMGKTLSAENISVKARTLRVYQDDSGDYLHIAHTINIMARRPDRMLVTATGDDGLTKMVYDSKQVSVLDANQNKYAQVAITGDLDHVIDEVSDRMGIDFPLADFLRSDPAKSFLTGVTSGKEVGTVNIDGAPCRHLFFTQSGSIELELWLEKNDRAVPRRLVVTYRAMPGQPNFVAEFTDWNFQSRPSDAEFAFQPPTGATKVELAGIQEGGSAGSTHAPNTGRQK